MLTPIIYPVWQVYLLPVALHARAVRCTFYFWIRLLQYQTGVSSSMHVRAVGADDAVLLSLPLFASAHCYMESIYMYIMSFKDWCWYLSVGMSSSRHLVLFNFTNNWNNDIVSFFFLSCPKCRLNDTQFKWSTFHKHPMEFWEMKHWICSLTNYIIFIRLIDTDLSTLGTERQANVWFNIFYNQHTIK